MNDQLLRIDGRDNVAVALVDLTRDKTVSFGDEKVMIVKVKSDIPQGHKIALSDLNSGDWIIKYGEPIGRAKAAISMGEHVHVHNVEDITEEEIIEKEEIIEQILKELEILYNVYEYTPICQTFII